MQTMPEIMPKLMPAVGVAGLYVIVWLAAAWAIEDVIEDIRQGRWLRQWW